MYSHLSNKRGRWNKQGGGQIFFITSNMQGGVAIFLLHQIVLGGVQNLKKQ